MESMTDLDRLLEIDRRIKHIQEDLDFDAVSRYREELTQLESEFQSLKSQLESKLAVTDSLYEKDKTIQKFELKVSYLQSQHTNLIKAIPQLIKDFSEEFLGVDYDYEKEKQLKELLDEWLPKQLQNLLESTEVKTND